MKRWLSGLLAALTLFSLAACGGTANLTDLPGDSRYEDGTVDLPTVEDLEDSGEEDPLPPADPFPGGEDPSAPEDAETLPAEPERPGNASSEDQSAGLDVLPENGTYTAKEDVALYIHTYNRLPDNFITKKEAQELGWPGGSLEPYAPGMCIGGSRFGNYEGLLPEAQGRTYTECDIDTLGAGSRGAKRIVFSNDGLIYYTEDHYESFELLYGDEGDG